MTRKDKNKMQVSVVQSKSPPALSSSGDIESVYLAHEAQLKGFIERRVELKEDAEDILQNVFYNLSRVDLAESPIEEITAWLYRVARNQIIDRGRKKKEERMPRVAAKHDDDFLRDISEFLSSGDKDDNPEGEYLKSLVWDELNDALNELPAEQRTVFELTELEGVSFKKISKLTGVPVNTLISRKHYAVLHLRKRLKELYDDLILE